MFRHLYSLALWLAQPWYRRKLARRAVAEPGYAHAVPERFGYYDSGPDSGPDSGGRDDQNPLSLRERKDQNPLSLRGRAGVGARAPTHPNLQLNAVPDATPTLWLHAVSLGETRAAAVLISALRKQHSGLRLLLTHGTATGRAEGTSLLQPGDQQAWLPWDTPGAVNRFLTHFRPCIGVLMETEVWPNLVHACQARSIPLVLANARLSDKSLRQAQRLAWLARPAYAGLTAVWAQTEADALRLRQLGAPVQGVLGNLKFDATPNPAQLAQGRAWRAQREQAGQPPVVMLASSREGEEAMLLALLKPNKPSTLVDTAQAAIFSIATVNPAVQWLIVPRHPQRISEVAALIEAHGFAVACRSQWPGSGPPANSPCIWLGDTLGEMPLYYALSQAALLGGSFAPLGGQNLIEAAACGCPVVMGPHTFNFDEVARLAEAAGAAQRVGDMAQGIGAALALARVAGIRTQSVHAAQTFASAHSGAASRTVAALLAFLKPQVG